MSLQTGIPDAHRVLRYSHVAAALARFQLPKYSALAQAQGDFSTYALAARLWRHCFPGEPLPHGDAWAVEEDFLYRVSREWFPISAGPFETMYSAEEHPLEGFIDYDSWGVAWEAGWGELLEQERPLAAVVALGLTPGEGWDDALMNFQDQATEYLTEHGWAPLDEDGAVQYGWIRQQLAGLPAPLDGLEVVYDCLRRDTGNEFLDTVGDFWRAEYDEEGMWWDWTAENLDLLRDAWRSAKPQVDRLLAYGEWWEAHRDAEAQVIAALARVLELEAVEEGFLASLRMTELEEGEDDDGDGDDL